MCTISLGGISGIGKSTAAAQFASEMDGPVCWVDSGLISSASQALASISEFLTKTLGDDAIPSAILGGQHGQSNLKAVARLIGTKLGASRSLIVWDGVDGDTEPMLREIIDAISATIVAGMQLITAQTFPQRAQLQHHAAVQIGRLQKANVRTLLLEAYPEARVPELDAADQATQGHPYLVQLLVGAAEQVDLSTAIANITEGTSTNDFVTELLGFLSPEARLMLDTLVWLELPFTPTYVVQLGGTRSILRELASRYAVVRAGYDLYRVHEIIGNLIKKSVSHVERSEAHERIALLLQRIEQPSWQEVRALLRHASYASMDHLVRQAGGALLDFAAQSGHWDLVRESATSLTSVPLSADHPYPHFMLGKCYRMTGHLDAALKQYACAESMADDDLTMQENARYERASVLWDLGKREEAERYYIELEKSEHVSVSVQSKTALAMGIAGRGQVADAVQLLNEASQIAEAAGLRHEMAAAQQAAGYVHICAERWDDARKALRKAYEVRFHLEGPESRDAYGWFHLYGMLLHVERALDNKEAARSAARGLFRFALVAGSPKWEAMAAGALCIAHPDPTDPEVALATTRLRATADDTANEIEVRVQALAGVVRCEWALQRYELAMVALLELLAIGDEHNVPIPVFAHVPSDASDGESVCEVPGGWLLLVPDGQVSDFVIPLINKVLGDRPELAQYTTAIVAVRPDDGPT